MDEFPRSPRRRDILGSLNPRHDKHKRDTGEGMGRNRSHNELHDESRGESSVDVQEGSGDDIPWNAEGNRSRKTGPVDRKTDYIDRRSCPSPDRPHVRSTDGTAGRRWKPRSPARREREPVLTRRDGGGGEGDRDDGKGDKKRDRERDRERHRERDRERRRQRRKPRSRSRGREKSRDRSNSRARDGSTNRLRDESMPRGRPTDRPRQGGTRQGDGLRGEGMSRHRSTSWGGDRDRTRPVESKDGSDGGVHGTSNVNFNSGRHEEGCDYHQKDEKQDRHDERHDRHADRRRTDRSDKYRDRPRDKDGVHRPLRLKRTHSDYNRHHRHRHHRRQRRKRHSRSRSRSRDHGHTGDRSASGGPSQSLDPDAAFRESLRDALEDEEGAEYWQGVYGQPIHVYEPPPTSDCYGSGEDNRGELERMTEEEYAAYVMQKMYERTHEGARERYEARQQAERAREQRRQEEARERLRQWRKKHTQDHGSGPGPGHEHEHGPRRAEYGPLLGAVDVEEALRQGEERQRQRSRRWEQYREAWARWDGNPKTIPWPTGQHDKPTDESGKDDLDEAASSLEKSVRSLFHWDYPAWLAQVDKSMADANKGLLRQQLKEERVRWHPDKMQQRMASHVDGLVKQKYHGMGDDIDNNAMDSQTGPMGPKNDCESKDSHDRTLDNEYLDEVVKRITQVFQCINRLWEDEFK